MAKVCIICQQETAGAKVADDIVIRGIRRAKQALGIAKNNELVVCRNDMEAYVKKRRSYERNLAVYMAIAGIVLVLLVFVPIFTTGFSAYAVLLGMLFAALLVLLPVVTSHTPALEGAVQIAEKATAAAAQAPAGKSARNASGAIKAKKAPARSAKKGKKR